MSEIRLVTGPSAQEKVQEDGLHHIAVVTSLEAYYTMPDMTREMVNELGQQLHQGSEKLIARNISGAMLVLPTRIVERVVLLSGEADWNIHVTSPQGRMGILWPTE